MCRTLKENKKVILLCEDLAVKKYNLKKNQIYFAPIAFN